MEGFRKIEARCSKLRGDRKPKIVREKEEAGS